MSRRRAQEVKKTRDSFRQLFLFVNTLQHSLELRLDHDEFSDRRVWITGYWQIGLCDLGSHIAVAASTGRHKAVLYIRKVKDCLETSASFLFWIIKTDEETVDIVACRDIDDQDSVPVLRRAIWYHFFNRHRTKPNNPTRNGIKTIMDGPRYDKREGSISWIRSNH